MIMDILQYGGVALGLLGALFVSMTSHRSRRNGFLLWIGSNALLIPWAIMAEAWGLFALYTVYSATSMMGWWNNREKDVPMLNQATVEAEH